MRPWFGADALTQEVSLCLRFPLNQHLMYRSRLAPLQGVQRRHLSPLILLTHFFFPFSPFDSPEMSVRMSNLDNERDERDEDSHEDRGISEYL